MIREFEDVAIETIQNETEKSTDLWSTLYILCPLRYCVPQTLAFLVSLDSQSHVLSSESPLGTTLVTPLCAKAWKLFLKAESRIIIVIIVFVSHTSSPARCPVF